MGHIRGPVLLGAFALQVTTSVAEAVREGAPVAVVGGEASELIHYLITQGGLTLLTAFVVWSYRKDLVELIQLQHTKLAELREDRKEFLEIIKTNTAALTRGGDTNERLSDMLTQVLQQLAARDRDPRERYERPTRQHGA